MAGSDLNNLQRIGFILMPGFALMSYAAAVEPLRAANLIAGREIYALDVFSSDGKPVSSSAGVVVTAAPLPKAGSGLAMVFVCAGGIPADWESPAVLSCLRQFAREGVLIGGISGGSFILARAGLLAGREFTIHWEHVPALIEMFPDLRPRQERFVVDGNRITCGGGVAPLDMMHVLIAERMGRDFARRVSDWYLHTHVSPPAEPQRASLVERYDVHHPALLAILEKMEGTIEHPLDRATMACFAGISPRHLDRLFADHMGSTFLAEYRKMRLQHARRLLVQSPLSISEIAYAVGFSSVGHFSRVYRNYYGDVPRALRK